MKREADLFETKNSLICGDNLEILPMIKKKSVDLIYIDPPFFSNKQYAVIWGDEAEIRSFEDRWAGGIENYISWMKPRVEAMYRVLKPTGSFYLHCDWHANAYLRIMLDEIFGKSNFMNEIIWHYFMGGKPKAFFARKHDVIFFYTKSAKWNFNYKEVERRLPKKPSLGSHKEVIKKQDGWYSIVGMDDVWDISGVFNLSDEYLAYPTQKPEKLLERIIRASSNKGDIVLDAFCGCGTAMAVAHKLKRNWIGIDISPTAIKLVERRLRKIGGVKNEHYITVGLPTTIKELKKLKPFEFQNWVLDEMGGIVSRKLVGDKGINGHLPETLWHEQAGIQVKQSERVGRNVVDNFETALRRKKYTKGYIIAFSFTKGAYEEVARVKNKGELDIRLITVKELKEKKRTLLK